MGHCCKANTAVVGDDAGAGCGVPAVWSIHFFSTKLGSNLVGDLLALLFQTQTQTQTQIASTAKEREREREMSPHRRRRQPSSPSAQHYNQHTHTLFIIGINLPFIYLADWASELV